VVFEGGEVDQVFTEHKGRHSIFDRLNSIWSRASNQVPDFTQSCLDLGREAGDVFVDVLKSVRVHGSWFAIVPLQAGTMQLDRSRLLDLLAYAVTSLMRVKTRWWGRGYTGIEAKEVEWVETGQISLTPLWLARSVATSSLR
jgi:hypothetical protein